jgi:DNA-binding transcriptional LysR family regulator
MLNLLHARSFLAVLDGRGFRAAGRMLNLSPSTVVEHVAHLEGELAAPLLVRRRGGVALTLQGSAFLPLARALVDTAERARAVVARSPLRIAASSNIGTYLLQPALASFKETDAGAPELWIGSNPEVADRLSAGRADVGLMEWWDGRPGFFARSLRRERLVVIVGRGHPWALRENVVIADLVGNRLLGGEPGTGVGTLLRKALGAAADRIEAVNGFGSTEAVKRAVRAGLGISVVLACSVEDEVAAGDLFALQLVDADLVKDIQLIVPERLPATSAAARFADHVVRQWPNSR